jgi:hypothetical protein
MVGNCVTRNATAQHIKKRQFNRQVVVMSARYLVQGYGDAHQHQGRIFEKSLMINLVVILTLFGPR